jgi:hypothetical protein
MGRYKMNFKKLFEVCEITPGPWVVAKSGHQHFGICIITKKDGGSICHFTPWSEVKNTAIIMSKSPELLKALIDYLIMDEWIVNKQHLTGLISEQERQEYIKLIESVLSSPEKSITWEEIKEILEVKE